MFVPETDHVSKFVYKNPKGAAPGSHRDSLFTSYSAYPRATAEGFNFIRARLKTLNFNSTGLAIQRFFFLRM